MSPSSYSYSKDRTTAPEIFLRYCIFRCTCFGSSNMKSINNMCVHWPSMAVFQTYITFWLGVCW